MEKDAISNFRYYNKQKELMKIAYLIKKYPKPIHRQRATHQHGEVPCVDERTATSASIVLTKEYDTETGGLTFLQQNSPQADVPSRKPVFHQKPGTVIDRKVLFFGQPKVVKTENRYQEATFLNVHSSKNRRDFTPSYKINFNTSTVCQKAAIKPSSLKSESSVFDQKASTSSPKLKTETSLVGQKTSNPWFNLNNEASVVDQKATTSALTLKGVKSKPRMVGSGKQGLKREKLKGLSNESIRRIATRGGVRLISKHAYNETRDQLRKFLTTIIQDAACNAEFSKRDTVFASDIIFALKRYRRLNMGGRGCCCMCVWGESVHSSAL